MRVFFFFLILLFISCKTNKNTNSNFQDSTVSTPLTLVVQDNYSGTENSENLIIKDSKRLAAFFAQVNKTRKPGLPVPEIDFTREMVLVVCSGKKEHTGMPTLSVYEENKDTIIVKINKNKPKTTSTTTITYPFSLYKIPLTDKVISFQ